LNPTNSLLTSIGFDVVEEEVEEVVLDLDVLAFAFVVEEEEEGLDFFEFVACFATGAISQTCKMDLVSF